MRLARGPCCAICILNAYYLAPPPAVLLYEISPIQPELAAPFPHRTHLVHLLTYSFVGQDLKIRMAALEDQVAKIQALAPSLCITRALRRAPRPRTLAP